MDHVLHSSIVPRLYIHMSFRFVDLHNCYFLIFKTRLRINPFMNLINRNAWAPVIKSTYDRISPFSHFECPPLKPTNKKNTQGNYLQQLKKRCSFPISVATTSLTNKLTVPCLESYSLGSANEHLQRTTNEGLKA